MGSGESGGKGKQGSITGAPLYELSYARHHNGLAGENDVFEPICLEDLAIASLANTMISTFGAPILVERKPRRYSVLKCDLVTAKLDL